MDGIKYFNFFTKITFCLSRKDTGFSPLMITVHEGHKEILKR